MDKVVNLGIPHVGEQIFATLQTDDLLQCLKVSQTWKALVGPILACKHGHKDVVKLILRHSSHKNIDCMDDL